MTIKYANGTASIAMILSHEQDEIRAVICGSDDVQIFRRVKGTWFSEEIEPVAIEFEFHTPGRNTPSLEECICSKKLAVDLLRRLFGGDGDDLHEGATALPNSHVHEAATVILTA
jgi:hypothetical protein